MVESYNRLVQVIRRFNSHYQIVVSSIIPRPVDFNLSAYRVEKVNQGLQQICEKRQKMIYNPTHKFFMKRGMPFLSYYSESDKLHLRRARVVRLQQAFQQALSDVNLQKANHWRRSRPGLLKV